MFGCALRLVRRCHENHEGEVSEPPTPSSIGMAKHEHVIVDLNYVQPRSREPSVSNSPRKLHDGRGAAKCFSNSGDARDIDDAENYACARSSPEQKSLGDRQRRLQPQWQQGKYEDIESMTSSMWDLDDACSSVRLEGTLRDLDEDAEVESQGSDQYSI